MVSRAKGWWAGLVARLPEDIVILVVLAQPGVRVHVAVTNEFHSEDEARNVKTPLQRRIVQSLQPADNKSATLQASKQASKQVAA